MGSQYPPKSYDETALVALEQAMRDVWQVLKARDPFRDWEKDPELQRVLGEKLIALADAGVKDPQQLCSLLPN